MPQAGEVITEVEISLDTTTTADDYMEGRHLGNGRYLPLDVHGNGRFGKLVSLKHGGGVGSPENHAEQYALVLNERHVAASIVNELTDQRNVVHLRHCREVLVPVEFTGAR